MKLELDKVMAAVNATASPAERDPSPPTGGWGPEAPDERSHFMVLTGTVQDQPTQVAVASLCGHYEGEAERTELDDCDPLARENCITCRTLLLQRLGLI